MKFSENFVATLVICLLSTEAILSRERACCRRRDAWGPEKGQGVLLPATARRRQPAGSSASARAYELRRRREQRKARLATSWRCNWQDLLATVPVCSCRDLQPAERVGPKAVQPACPAVLLRWRFVDAHLWLGCVQADASAQEEHQGLEGCSPGHALDRRYPVQREANSRCSARCLGLRALLHARCTDHSALLQARSCALTPANACRQRAVLHGHHGLALGVLPAAETVR